MTKRTIRETVKEYEGYLACGIANVINTFRPEKVILGGGVPAIHIMHQHHIHQSTRLRHGGMSQK